MIEVRRIMVFLFGLLLITSLAYAELKIEEIKVRKRELDLMEKDIRAMKEALEQRLQELKT